MIEKKRIYLLDYCKAVAICLVILTHCWPNHWDEGWKYYVLTYVVRMAVPIFVLISGYVYAISMEKVGKWTNWYTKRFFARVLYYLIPNMVAICFFCCMRIAQKYTINSILYDLALSNYGQGAYYFCFLWFLLLIYPFIYILVKKGGLIYIAAINILFEITLYIVPIDKEIYRIIPIRYILLLGIGTWLYINRQKKINQVSITVSFLFGIIYILIYTIYGANTNIFKYGHWGNTSVCVCLYVGPIMCWLINRSNSCRIKKEIVNKFVLLVGQNTLYILVVQMMWFWVAPMIYNRVSVPYQIQIILAFLVSLSIGIVWGEFFGYSKLREILRKCITREKRSQ